MRRRPLLVAVGLAALGGATWEAALGATPRRAAPLDLTAPDAGAALPVLPLPPAPPATSPAYQAAPMPDADLSAPAAAPNAGPRLSPDIFNQPAFNGGQGYTPGSTIESQQEQRQKPVPGLNLKMPLQ